MTILVSSLASVGVPSLSVFRHHLFERGLLPCPAFVLCFIGPFQAWVVDVLLVKISHAGVLRDFSEGVNDRGVESMPEIDSLHALLKYHYKHGALGEVSQQQAEQPMAVNLKMSLLCD